MHPFDTNRLLELYERGDITRMELRTCLVQAATKRVPDELALALSQDLIDELREETRSLQERKVIAIGMSLETMREETRLFNEGLRRWHQYFNR